MKVMIPLLSIFLFLFCGTGKASFEQGMEAYESWNISAAIEILGTAVRAGDLRAGATLAKINQRGYRLTSRDESNLLDSLLIAASKGSVEAKGELGSALRGGRQVIAAKVWSRYSDEQPKALGYLIEACDAGYSHSCRLLAEISRANPAESERWVRKMVAIQRSLVEKGDFRYLSSLAFLPVVVKSEEWTMMRATYHALERFVAGEPLEQHPIIGPLSESRWADAIREAKAIASTYNLLPAQPTADVALRIANRLLATSVADDGLIESMSQHLACSMFQFLSPTTIAKSGWEGVFKTLSTGSSKLFHAYQRARERAVAASHNETRDWLLEQLEKEFSGIQLVRIDRYLDRSIEKKRSSFEREVVVVSAHGTVVLARLQFDPAMKSLGERFQGRLGAYAKSKGLDKQNDGESGANDRRISLVDMLTRLQIWMPRSLGRMMLGMASLELSNDYDRLSRFIGPSDLADVPFIGSQTQRKLGDVRTKLSDRLEARAEVQNLNKELLEGMDRIIKSIEGNQ